MAIRNREGPVDISHEGPPPPNRRYSEWNNARIPPRIRSINGDVDDAALEIQQIGHNLMSVLANPRDREAETIPRSNSSALLYAFDVMGGKEHENFTSFFTRTEEDITSIEPFLSKTGDLATTFLNNHKLSRSGDNGMIQHMDEKRNDGRCDTKPQLHSPSGSRKCPTSETSISACCKVVPAIYFNPKYSLEGPEILENLLCITEAEKQEELTAYLEMVETCLLDQVISRSDAFLESLDTVHVLKRHVSEACGSVCSLRQAMQCIDEDVVMTALRVPELACRQKNLVALQERLSVMQEVQHSMEAISALLSGDDLSGALDIVDCAQKLLKDGDFQQLHCMTGLSQKLDDYAGLVGDLLSSRFVTFALEGVGKYMDASKLVKSESVKEGDGWQQEEQQQLKDGPIQESQRDDFLKCVHGLLRLERIPSALGLYQKQLEDELKLIVRTVVGDYLSSSNEDGTLLDVYDPSSEDDSDSVFTPSMKRLQTLEHSGFLSCLEMCFDNIETALRRATAVRNFLSHSLLENKKKSEIEGPSSPTSSINPSSPAGAKSTVQHINNCLKNAGDLVERTISQLLDIRKSVHSCLSADQLKQVWLLTNEFVKRMESLTGTKRSKLHLTLLNQCKLLVDRQHEVNKKQLVLRLDTEKWIQADVPINRQKHMNRICGGQDTIYDSNDNGNSSSSWKEKEDSEMITETKNGGAAGGKQSLKKEAIVDGASYKAVWSALVLIEMLAQMMRLSALFPEVATDVLSRTVDLLRLFNSRTTQLVLGAGALHSSSGLKSISAKHLALCAQSLSLLRALVPHLRAGLAFYLPKHGHYLLSEMDRANQDFLEHHDKILSKFVNIIHDAIEGSSKSLQQEDWDVSKPDEPICNFSKEVVKSVTILYKVLAQQLPPEQMKELFSRILMLLSKLIPDYFSSLSPRPNTELSRARVLKEASFISNALLRLPGMDSKNMTLYDTMRGRLDQWGEESPSSPPS